MKIKVIIGSVRAGRFSEKSGKWIFEILKAKEGIEAEVVDLKDYPLPFYDNAKTPTAFNGEFPNEMAGKFAAKIREADAFVIVTPEYNHSVSGVLTNAMDWVYAEWNNKPVAFVAHGGVGGARAVEHLRGMAIELQMAPIRSAVHIVAPWMLTDESGALKPGALDGYVKGAETMITQLMWWGKALKAARNQG